MTLAWPRAGRAEEAAAPKDPTATPPYYVTSNGKPTKRLDHALAVSRYVYVSPLHADGRESTCHGEIWYAWIDGAVLSSTAAKGWKARAIASGRHRARLWVGDYGRWKGRTAGGTNIAFRHGPTFIAKATTSTDAALLERLLAVYAKKYPKEIDSWAGKMRKQLAADDRVLLRYVPDAS